MSEQPRQPVWDTSEDAVALPTGHTWTPQEHWAWARILRGEVADLSRFDPSLDRAADFSAWFAGKPDGAHEIKATDEGDALFSPDQIAAIVDAMTNPADLARELDTLNLEQRGAFRKALESNIVRWQEADLNGQEYSLPGAMADALMALKTVAPWPAHRKLSQAFMRQILFYMPHADARARPWVRIACAQFDEELAWQNDTFGGELGLKSCRFSAVNWVGLRIGRRLDLGGSRFAFALRAADLFVDGDFLCLNGLVVKGGVELVGARIRGNADFSRATINGEFVADRCAIDGDLRCMEGFSSDGDVRLLGASVEGVAAFTGAALAGALEADRIFVSGNLHCDGGFSANGGVRLLGARIRGDVAMIGAALGGALEASNAVVEGVLFLREMKRLGDADLVSARVGRDMHLLLSVIEGSINLTGAVIEGELHHSQGASQQGPKWGDQARLTLRNATIGALAGGFQSWPKAGKGEPPPMELEGLAYARLGGLGAGNSIASTLAAASPEELKSWLAAGHPVDEFTPGPYQQLAASLVAAGRRSAANSVLHEMRRHERRCERRPLRKLGLGLYGVAVGFSFRNDFGVFWFLTLVAAFTAFGLNAQGFRSLDFTSAGCDELLRWLGFSFGNAIPLIQFDKAHETFLADQFANGRVQDVPVAIAWAFYAQKALGFAILSFLAAGLTSAATRDRR